MFRHSLRAVLAALVLLAVPILFAACAGTGCERLVETFRAVAGNEEVSDRRRHARPRAVQITPALRSAAMRSAG